MPETPDFEQIARAFLGRHFDAPHGSRYLDLKVAPALDTDWITDIVEQLRLVWNARGAADLVKLEAELTAMMGGTASGPYVKNLDRALRRLDR